MSAAVLLRRLGARSRLGPPRVRVDPEEVLLRALTAEQRHTWEHSGYFRQGDLFVQNSTYGPAYALMPVTSVSWCGEHICLITGDVRYGGPEKALAVKLLADAVGPKVAYWLYRFPGMAVADLGEDKKEKRR